MKRIVSFISKNVPTMEKHYVVPSSSPLGITNKQPMKRKHHRHKKHAAKHFMFNKVVSYLTSDAYMYSPLVSHQPSLDFLPPKHLVTSPGFEDDAAIPVKGRRKNLIEKVVEYLEADCYMYSPLVTNESVCANSHASNENSGGQMQKGGSTVGEGVDLSSQLGARPVVKKTVATTYRESLKHRLH